MASGKLAAELLRPKRLAHLLVSLALLGWIARSVDWGEFAGALARTELRYLALSAAMSPVLIGLSAWKWRILLRARSLDAGLGTCMNLYVIGYLFNNLLPTNVGGDVVRGYLMGKRTGDPFTAVAAVFLERLTGLAALVVLALVVVPFGPEGGWEPWVFGFVAAVAAAFAGLVWILLDGRAAGLLRRHAHRRAVEKLLRFHEALGAYRGHRRALARCLGLSVLFYAGAAMNIHFSARAFGGHLDVGETFAATPVILLITMLPISFGGIGLSEWAHIHALGRFGVSPAVGLSTALLLRMKGVLLGMAGSVIYPVYHAGPLRAAVAESQAPPASEP